MALRPVARAIPFEKHQNSPKNEGGALRAHGAALLETFATKDWPALRGTERHGGFLAALRTARLGFGAHGRGPAATATFCALGLAGLAALRLIFETFIGEEHLFSAGKDKLSAALGTL
jgi:hypothetical protein